MFKIIVVIIIIVFSAFILGRENIKMWKYVAGKVKSKGFNKWQKVKGVFFGIFMTIITIFLITWGFVFMIF